MAYDRSQRTYHVSDERLRAFRALTPEERLRWVEELALFLRLAQAGGGRPRHPTAPEQPPPCEQDSSD
jgi:hypothetical protein